MRKTSNLSGLVMVSVALLGSVGTTQADTVYDNSVNDLGIRFSAANGVQFGDEITLAGTSRYLTNFSFEYFGENFSGNETVTLRIYENNGPLVNGVPSPGSIPLFTYAGFSIIATNRATITYDQATLGGGFLVPDTFTWTVEFSGIDGAGESAGLDLYGPVSVGSSFGDYWQLNGASWQLLSNSVTAISFGATAQATVPEPGTMALLALGGLVGALVWNRRRVA